jgi:hypothetical protein
MQFWIKVAPGKLLSRFWRMNCVNKDTVRSVTTSEAFPIKNPFNTTVMPQAYRIEVFPIQNLVNTMMMPQDYRITS